MLSITDAGAGQTRWVFSGSTIVDHNSRENSFWGRAWDAGRVVKQSRYSSTIAAGSGTLTTSSGGTVAVDDVWTQTDFRSEIAVRLDEKILWRAGDTLSWSGDLIVNVDINTLNKGVYKTSRLLNGGISDDYVLSVGDLGNPVPEPASLAMWGLAGTLGLVIARRRKRTLVA